MAKWIRWTLVMAVLLSMTAVACSEDEGGEAGDPISVTEVWGWSSTPDRAAVYFMVENTGDEADRLVAVASDVAGIVQVHETTMVDGTASMAEVESVDVPAGGSVTFEPGGYHLMLMEIPEPLEVGASFDVTLTFERAGEVDVTAEIREFTGEMEGDEEM